MVLIGADRIWKQIQDRTRNIVDTFVGEMMQDVNKYSWDVR